MKKLFRFLSVLLSAVITFSCSENDDEVSSSGIVGGHEYIDLGLPSGLKWATMNIGATSPEEYGDYFAWGETEPKDYYDWSTYKWCRSSNATLTKYNNHSRLGTVDNKTVLNLSDDAAHVYWGGDWRMPTVAEFNELRENCTWTWTTQKGVKGCKVKGPNGKSLFLPAAGMRLYDDLDGELSYGYYWSSSLHTDVANEAFGLDLYSDNVNCLSGSREFGLTVRAVCQ